MQRVPVEWVTGMTEQERDEFNVVWANSRFILDKLKGILQRDLDRLTTDTDQDYAVANWAMLRADKNGQMRSIERVLKLLP